MNRYFKMMIFDMSM